jgi:hypothetical protein
LIFAICGLLVFAGSAFADLSMTCGGQENYLIFRGAVLPLASWLLCLLLSFDYQNPYLLFLKLQVQDQNDYFWQTV